MLTLFKMLWYNLFVVKYFMWRNTQVWLKGPVLKTGRSATARGFESLFLRHLIYIAEWSSLVARWAHNPKVVGSNPSSATIWFRSVVVITSACHAEDREFEPRRNRHLFWLRSSVGRARDWKSLCRWFDSGRSHHFLNSKQTLFALVAQLDRVFGYEPKGQGFESLRAHHISGNGSTW